MPASRASLRLIAVGVCARVLLCASGASAVPALGEPEVAGRWSGWQGVRALASSPDGFLWMATQQGLVRFDGTRFRVFDGADHPGLAGAATCVRSGRDGGVWVGMQSGALLFRPALSSQRFEQRGQVGGPVLAIAEGGGDELWLGGPHGLTRLAGGKLEPLAEPNEPITALAVDGTGALFIGNERGLWRRDERGLVRVPDAGEITAIAAIGDGTVFIGTNQRLYRLDGAAQAPTLGSFRNYHARALALDRDGALWVGREMAGLNRIEGPRDRAFGTSDGLPDLGIASLTVDAIGRLWAATESGVLFMMRPRNVVSLGTQDGLLAGPTFGALEGERGAFWVSMVSGISVIRGTTIERLRNGDSHVPAHCLRGMARAADDSIFIASCDKGLIRFHAGEFTLVDTPVSRIHNVWVDREDAVWIADNRGQVWSRVDGEFQSITLGQPPCDGSRRPNSCEGEVIAFAEGGATGEVWLATQRRGLYQLERREVVRHFTGADGLPDAPLTALHRDRRGVLWIGSAGGGLGRLDGRLAFVRDGRHGLPSIVHGVIEDAAERFWISSDSGVFRARRDDVDAVLAGRLEHRVTVAFGVADGLTSVRAARNFGPSIWLTRDQRLLVPTVGGLAIFDARPEPTAPPQTIYVEAVTVDGERFPVTNGTLVRTSRGGGNIVVTVTAPGLHAPHGLEVKARLAGVSDWQRIDGPTISFANVPAGSHVFEASARRPGVVDRESVIVLPIELLALYQRGWFQALVAMTGLVAIFTLASVQRRQLHIRTQAVLDERRRLAQDLHDTLAVSFTGIGYQLATLRQVLGESASEKARQLLADAEAMVRHSRQEARRSMWNVRSQALELRSLREALAAIADEVRKVGSADVELHVEEDVPELPRPLAEALLRVVQEGIVNAMAHGHARHVRVDLGRGGAKLRLVVSDDGEGMPAERDDGLHLGLQGMADRITDLGGRFTINSVPGDGTRIEVELTLPRRMPAWRRWLARTTGTPS